MQLLVQLDEPDQLQLVSQDQPFEEQELQQETLEKQGLHCSQATD